MNMLSSRCSILLKCIRRPQTRDPLNRLVFIENKIFRNFSVLLNGNCRRTPACSGAVNFCKHSSKAELSNIDQEIKNDNEDGDKKDDLVEEMPESLFKEITNGDPQMEQKLRDIVKELDVLRGMNCTIPKKLRKKDWCELLIRETFSQRKKFLSFRCLNERKKEKADYKKKLFNEKRLEMQRELNTEQRYGIMGMSMFHRIYPKTLNSLLNQRLLSATVYSQTIVFDLSYDHYMSRVCSSNCALQLLYAFNCNRSHPAPFHIKLCNVNNDDQTFTFFKRELGLLGNDTHPLDVHEESYMDLFPREKLVYLSPHASKPLLKYNHDDVYIIGAFVDKAQSVKVSLAKAAENNLRVAKLPLDNFVSWKQGGKSLPVNIVLKILLDVRWHNNWPLALHNISRRCVDTNDNEYY